MGKVGKEKKVQMFGIFIWLMIRCMYTHVYRFVHYIVCTSIFKNILKMNPKTTVTKQKNSSYVT